MNELQTRENEEIMESEVVPQKLTNAIRLDIIEEGLRKKYLSRLTEMRIAPVGEILPIEDDLIDNVRLYNIKEMVYHKGEPVTDKFTTVFNTLSTYNAIAFVIMDSDGQKTDYYVGVRNNEIVEDKKRSTVTLGDTLKNTLIGHFPGIKIENEDRASIAQLSERIRGMQNVTSVSVVGSSKTDKEQTNEQFVQGLEKLAYAMQGRQYTGIIIAESQSPQIAQILRDNYQDLYTKLSPFKSEQFTSSYTIGKSRSQSFSEMNGKQKAAMIGGAIAAVGGVFAGAAGGYAAMQAGKAAGDIVKAVGNLGPLGGSIVGGQAAGQLSGFINSLAPVEQIQRSTTEGKTTTIENKAVSNLLQLIDDGLKRIDEFDSYGLWNVAGYFISDDIATAEIAASNYRSLMNGEKSGREVSAINSWRSNDPLLLGDFQDLTTYLSRFVHPQFLYGSQDMNYVLTNASTAISGKELGLHIGLPRATVSGLPVIEHAEFGKEVTAYRLFDGNEVLKPEDRMDLGKVFDLGKVTDKTVELANKSLNMHTFITGSTGSGKSNTVYQMLCELHQDKIPFLVVEPAKGEYKDVFGNWPDVQVYSTNPNVADLININPFMFPESIHVLEHIDGLVEIFSVCWPLYDAMPAFFKEAILRSYEEMGWDLGSSTFDGDEVEYPDFEILADQLDKLIEQSDYASDIKSNYRGALITRVRSLTVGLNKYIFTSEQTPYEILFDENCILDISRVKSSETKALIMGLMVYILNEYRMDQKSGSNRGLQHVTVLEEAHNLLKNTTVRDSDLMGKSVEMITQTIAEIRTCGEGFIIVDQSPSSVDIAAIKNTNTKIVLRTPEANDREAVGRSIGLTDDQVNEIAKLPSGVAVVYQNDWVSPVLTMINKAKVKEQPYVNENPVSIKSKREARTEIIKAIMEPWMPDERIDFSELASGLNSLEISRESRVLLSSMIYTYRNHNGHILWDEGSLDLLKNLLFDILNISKKEYEDAKQSGDLDSLRRIILSRTNGFTIEQLEEVCHMLILEV